MLVASVDSRRPLQLLDIQERQELKAFEDQLIDIFLVLDSTLDTISSFKEKYQEFCLDIKPPLEDQANKFDSISCALEEKQREVLLTRKKVEALHTKIQGTMTLVKF